jgi:hypothetical protein
MSKLNSNLIAKLSAARSDQPIAETIAYFGHTREGWYLKRRFRLRQTIGLRSFKGMDSRLRGNDKAIGNQSNVIVKRIGYDSFCNILISPQSQWE